MGLLIAIGVGLALALLVYDRIQQAKRQRDEPTCGQCGYCVRGIPSLICPECGSDLREVGILVPFRLPNPRLRTFTHLLIWTLLVPLPAIYLLELFSQILLPLRSTAVQAGQMICNTEHSQAAIQLRLWGQQAGIGKTTNIKMTTLTLMTFSHYPHDEPLVVDVASRNYSFIAADTKKRVESSELSADAIGQWLASQGLTPENDSKVAERSDEILTIVNAIIHSDMAALQQFRPPQLRPQRTQSYPAGRGRGQNPAVATVTTAPTTVPVVMAMFNSVPNISTDRIFWTYPVLLGIPIIVWLAGAYVLIRHARGRAQRVPVTA